MIPEYLKLSTIAQVIKKEAKQKQLPDLARKITLQRWASAIFLSTILSFLLAPQLHFSYPEYTVGSIAIRDVRANRDFRYAGPKFQSKETGLVLVADVVEASSRALSAPTPARIRNLVRERIEKRIYGWST
ncbi:MAG: hypothetical protein ABR911_06675 [Syntrophales bacterium]|jgi:hypothetical protein